MGTQGGARMIAQKPAGMKQGLRDTDMLDKKAGESYSRSPRLYHRTSNT